MVNNCPYGLTIFSTDTDQNVDSNSLITLASITALSDIRLMTLGAYSIKPFYELENDSYTSGGGILIDNNSNRKTFSIMSQNFVFSSMTSFDSLFSVLDLKNKYLGNFDYPRTLCLATQAIQVSLSDYSITETPPNYRVELNFKRVK